MNRLDYLKTLIATNEFLSEREIHEHLAGQVNINLLGLEEYSFVYRVWKGLDEREQSDSNFSPELREDIKKLMRRKVITFRERRFYLNPN